MAKKKLLLIDAYSIIHRAYHALAASGSSFTSPSGEPTSAVYGLSLMLLKALSDLKPDMVVAALDLSGPTFRHKEFEAYKAQRAEAPDALSRQVPKVLELFKAFSIPVLSRQGFEADDIIATLAVKAPKDTETIIATGDQDTLQLVNDKTFVFAPKKGFSDTILYDAKTVKELKGVEPAQMVDLKGLAGDPSDNIPGVAGIGLKGAQTLIQEFGSIENIYKNLSKVPARYQKILTDQKETALKSKALVTLEKKVPGIELPKSIKPFDPNKVKKIFVELGFRSLLNRIPGLKKVEAGELFPVKKGPKTEADKLDEALEPVLKKMSQRGVLIDPKRLNALNGKLVNRLDEMKKEIYEHAGQKFNLNSPSQLAVILFDKLNLPKNEIKKIKTGISTAAAELEKLREIHPIIDLLLEYRELEKLRTTYVSTLPKLADKDNRLHTEFTQTTSTGRLASRNPNLQNIPARSGWGTAIRQAFIAPKNYSLLAADYSQIELMLAAVLANDKKLMAVFKHGGDVHAATAAELFKKKPAEISKDERRFAKTINFGILYGMGPHGLAVAAKMSRAEAKEFIEKYFRSFPRVKAYLEETIESARQKGYVETLFGRRRETPEINSPNFTVRAAAEREAINAPIQGSAADIIKKAMLAIEKGLPKISPKSRMVLQVHDELLFEVPAGEEKKVAQFVKEKMEKVVKLPVTLKVEVSTGNNWGELRKMED